MESSIENEEKTKPLLMERVNGHRYNKTSLAVLDDFFHCDTCHRRYTLRKSLVRHCKKHLSAKPYSCYYCGKLFTEHYKLLWHARFHKSENDFQEKILLMQSAKDIVAATDLFTKVTSSSLTQSFLPASSNNNNNNNNDTNINDNKNKTFPCPECGKLFLHRRNIARHIKIHKRSLLEFGYFNCMYCDRVFKQKDDLKEHLEYDHRQMIERLNNDEIIMDSLLSELFLNNYNSNDNGDNSECQYICDVCKKPFARKDTLATHERIHRNERPFACDKCDKTFKIKGHLSRHAKQHKDDLKSFILQNNNNNSIDNNRKNNFVCKICDKMFTRKSSLIKHRILHSDVRPFACDKCDKTFKLIEYRNQHAKQHEDGNKSSYVCQICNRSFARKDTLNTHLRIHRNERPYACDKCDKTFKMKAHLTRHAKLHKDDLKSFILQNNNNNNSSSNNNNLVGIDVQLFACDKCDETFRIKEHLSRHYKREHENDFKTFTCKHCSRHFDGKSTFLRHFSEEHALDKISRCKICRRNFHTRSDMIRHLEDEHANSSCYVCAYCYKRYSNKYFLTKHLEGHVNRTDFFCRHCHKYFKLESHLLDHMKVDPDERPFVCTICSKRFKLNIHLKFHTKSSHVTTVDRSVRYAGNSIRNIPSKRHLNTDRRFFRADNGSNINSIKDTTITTKDTAITTKDTATTTKDTAITTKDTAITTKDTAITTKDTAITNKDTTIITKDTTSSNSSSNTVDCKEELLSEEEYLAVLYPICIVSTI